MKAQPKQMFRSTLDLCGQWQASLWPEEESTCFHSTFMCKQQNHTALWKIVFHKTSTFVWQDMIHIADTKVARRYGDFFIRQIHKFEEVR